jgi:AraC-like DNA-binding protein
MRSGVIVCGMAMNLHLAQLQPDATSEPKLPACHEFVDVAALRCFHELVKQLGGDPIRLLRRARINPAVFSKPKSIVECASLLRVMEYAARELSCPDFGLRLAAMQGGTTTISPIGVVMKNSKTLRQAIGYCAKFIRPHSLPTRIRLEPDHVNHLLFVWVDISLEGLADKRQTVEKALMLASLNILEITGRAARARKILFSHAPQSTLKTYYTHFGCEVLFGQKADGLVLSEGDLQCPVVNPNSIMFEMATSFIQAQYPASESPLPERVRGLIRLSLGKDCTSDRVATDLYMHRRTMQRRLRAEGTSFEAIKDQVRREVAVCHLREENMTMARLAELLGYAETSVLSRSISRWFSVTPRQLRIRLKSDGFSSRLY